MAARDENEAKSEALMASENGETMKHILEEDENYKHAIYGLFYRLSFGTVLLNRHSVKHAAKSGGGCLASVRRYLPLLFVVPVFARTVFMLGQLSKTSLLTQNWAITFTLAFLSVHGFVSALMLFSWNSNNLINEFAHRIHMLVKSEGKHTHAKQYRVAHILALLFFLVYMYTMVYFSAENFLFSDLHTRNPNSTAFFRESLTGVQSLWPVDVLIIVWTAFLSATALVLYFLVHHALTVRTSDFNEDLKRAAESGQLQHADLLNNYGSRHLELLTVIKYANDSLNTFCTPSLMTFVVVHFGNSFILRSFSDFIDTPQKIMCINFAILGLLALLVVIKKPAAVHISVHETKNILFFEKGAWRNEAVASVAQTITERITRADYSARVYDGYVIAPSVFHIVFTVFPIAVEVLARYKKFMD